MFKYDELKQVIRQRNQISDNVVNIVRLGTDNKNIDKVLKARFIDQSEKNYPYYAYNMYAQNASTVLRNKTAINNLPSEVYSIEANKNVLDDCRYYNLLQLKISVKLMLTINIDIQDQVNGQVGEVYQIVIAQIVFKRHMLSFLIHNLV